MFLKNIFTVIILSTAVFTGMKLCGFVQWPWITVLLPLWIGLSIVLIILAVCFVIYELKDKQHERHWRGKA